MILKIILFILFTLILILFTLFTLYILIPSTTRNENVDDALIPYSMAQVILPEEKKYLPSDKKAYVLCSCNKKCSLERLSSNSQYTCIMAKTAYGTGLDCPFACIGLGDCVRICPQQAIVIENMTAVITKNCCGCGKCEEICPQNIIRLIPKNTQTLKVCNNNSEQLTSCSKYQTEENISWKDKKDFKIWEYCYKILERFKKI